MTTDTEIDLTVTEKAMRPASDECECFYCYEPVGGTHLPTCVLVSKKVRVRLVVEYEVDVPNSWGKGNIEFHRNEGSWCANNALDELQYVFESDDSQGCMCGHAHFEYVGNESEPFLDEG